MNTIRVPSPLRDYTGGAAKVSARGASVAEILGDIERQHQGMRFRARPGVTGLAQVSGCRGPTETDSKIRARTRYDFEYVQAWSWTRELSILVRTAALFWKDDPGAV